MQLTLRFLYVGILAVFAMGCAVPKTTSTSTSSTKYSEDLSILRSVPEEVVDTNSQGEQDIHKQKAAVEPKYAVNKQLNAVLDSIDRINLRRNFIDGFTIQVYSGLKREDALNTKKMITSSLPDLESEIQYTQPNFKVKVGTYFNRMDAQKDYVAVKKFFPTAIVVPDKVAIN
jgi:hypothetical protein